ncbi:zinc finger with UFM1-specific peptidase domain protein-like, partial [Asbolus verrucosus]
MASNIPDFYYSCEICGLEGLSEDEFRTHTHTAHVDGNAVCPFCELSAVSPAELILHVNQAHLDFLTPESESNMTFIDDVSPSEYNGINGESSNNWNIPSLPSQSNNVNHISVSGNKSNINNINLSPKVNGGGELSPKNSTHGQGSPLRSSLALKLKSASPKLQCPMCNYTSTSPNELEEHVNRRHFDLTSPSVGGTTGEIFSCPLCVKCFNSAPDLELHVNIEHRDVLSPASPPTHTCPVCGITLDSDSNSEGAARHVESHFPAGSPQPAERAALREREQREFEMLRAQYGMDNQGNFREQSVTNMQRAVYAGEMSVADYYERTLDLRAAESCGVDDGSSITRS